MSDIELPPEIDAQVEDKKDRELLNRVALGEDFERFIRGHLGRHLIARADQERSELLEKIVSLDPRQDEFEMRRVQQRIAVIDSWQEWCAEAISEGHLAEREFLARNE
jgi:hypothetical protein